MLSFVWKYLQKHQILKDKIRINEKLKRKKLRNCKYFININKLANIKQGVKIGLIFLNFIVFNLIL
jgi:hypothetical protein